MKKKHIFIFIACVLTGSVCLLYAQSDPKKIVVGTGNNFIPMAFVDDQGNPDGMLIDQWRLWSEKTGVEVEFRLMPWAEAIPALMAGEVDAVEGVSYTAERAIHLDMTHPHTRVDTHIFYHRNLGSIRSMSDLKGFPVGILKGSNVEEFVNTNHTDIRPILYENFDQMARAAKDNRICVCIGEDPTLSYFLTKAGCPGLFLKSRESIISSDIRVAVRKGDTRLLELIKRGLNQISDADRGSLRKKWSGISLTEKASWRWIFLGGGFLLVTAIVIVSLLLFWNRQLKIHVRNATDSLRESEKRFRDLVEQSPLAIQMHDTTGRMILINNAWKAMWEVSDPRSIFSSYNLFKDPQLKEYGYDRIFHKALAGETVEIPDCVYDPKKSGMPGKKKHTHARVYPLKEETGKVKGVVVLHEDKTEKKALEQRLQQAEKLEAIGQLAGGVAHDFNNMLSGIMGFADILALELEDGELRDMAESIIKAARQSAQLTQQLLAYARKGQYRKIPIDIHQSISDAVSLLKHSLDRKIQVLQTLHASPSVIVGDPAQLQNALLNLAINARDAMPDGGHLTIETSIREIDSDSNNVRTGELAPGTFVCITVTDNGVGISREHQQKIFEPFFTTKSKGEGTGMGLAAVYGIVRAHNGIITVESEPGSGSTFHILLPVSTEAVEQTAVIDDTDDLKADNPLHILVIDDEEIARDTAVKMLERLGHTVASTESSHQGVSYFSEHAADVHVVILDMVMPEMGGRAVFQELRKIHPSVKVLLSSGYSIDGEAQEILDEGVSGFIQKPFVLRELRDKIRKISE